MYLTLRKSFYWTTLAMDCHAPTKLCATCAMNCVRLRKEKKPVKLFPATTASRIRQHRKSWRDNYLPAREPPPFLITDRLRKLVSRVPLRKITLAALAEAFIDHWAYYYGLPKTLLSHIGKQFVAGFFIAIGRILGIRNVFMTT